MVDQQTVKTFDGYLIVKMGKCFATEFHSIGKVCGRIFIDRRSYRDHDVVKKV
jgi:hypothetical protein